MDRQMLLFRERHIAAQERIVADFNRRGENADRALQLLESFNRSLDQHIQDRDRLLRELDRAPGGT